MPTIYNHIFNDRECEGKLVEDEMKNKSNKYIYYVK